MNTVQLVWMTNLQVGKPSENRNMTEAISAQTLTCIENGFSFVDVC
jgi:hypothetical protein